MKNQAFAIYEVDQWLMKSSRICMGVFTNKKKLKSAIRKLAEEQLERKLILAHKGQSRSSYIREVCREIEENGQYSGYDAGILVETIELNKYKEI